MIGDKNEMNRKLENLAKAALRFKRCSNRLVDAANAIAKHDGGTPAHKNAFARYESCDAEYVAAERLLDELIEVYK